MPAVIDAREPTTGPRKVAIGIDGEPGVAPMSNEFVTFGGSRHKGAVARAEPLQMRGQKHIDMQALKEGVVAYDSSSDQQGRRNRLGDHVVNQRVGLLFRLFGQTQAERFGID
jgi:hypothetical protein